MTLREEIIDAMVAGGKDEQEAAAMVQDLIKESRLEGVFRYLHMKGSNQ